MRRRRSDVTEKTVPAALEIALFGGFSREYPIDTKETCRKRHLERAANAFKKIYARL